MNTVDQRRASPTGDAVGRDKITNIQHAHRRSQIDGWLEKLADEMRCDSDYRDFVDSLQYYLTPAPHDDISGLDAKLEKAGRSSEMAFALRKKEEFAKLLATWQAYPTAQEIIAYFLTRIENSFRVNVSPFVNMDTITELDIRISETVIEPILAEMGTGPFMLNYNHVAGMVYWLADRCYVRWHA